MKKKITEEALLKAAVRSKKIATVIRIIEKFEPEDIPFTYLDIIAPAFSSTKLMDYFYKNRTMNEWIYIFDKVVRKKDKKIAKKMAHMTGERLLPHFATSTEDDYSYHMRFILDNEEIPRKILNDALRDALESPDEASAHILIEYGADPNSINPEDYEDHHDYGENYYGYAYDTPAEIREQIIESLDTNPQLRKKRIGKLFPREYKRRAWNASQQRKDLLGKTGPANLIQRFLE